MPSYSRNSRSAVQVLRLAIASVVQGGALLAGSAAHADQPGKFVMTVYTNGPGGANLASGNFQTAVAQMQHADPSNEATPTNKCVAYTMTGQFAAAQSLCDTAIRQAKSDLLHAAPSMLWKTADLEECLAIAYSNRAVLHWLSKDAVAAARDLADAAALSPQAQFVARNISALHSPHDSHQNAVAQAVIPPSN